MSTQRTDFNAAKAVADYRAKRSRPVEEPQCAASRLYSRASRRVELEIEEASEGWLKRAWKWLKS